MKLFEDIGPINPLYYTSDGWGNDYNKKMWRSFLSLEKWDNFLFDVYYSEDIYQDSVKLFGGPGDILRSGIGDLLFGKLSLFKKLESILSKSGLKAVLLCAHGKAIEDEWFYADINGKISTKNPDIYERFVNELMSKLTKSHDGSMYSSHEGVSLKLRTINSWIESLDDDKYGAIIISSCNKGNLKPRSRTIPIFYATDDVGWLNDNTPTVLIPITTKAFPQKRCKYS